MLLRELLPLIESGTDIVLSEMRSPYGSEYRLEKSIYIPDGHLRGMPVSVRMILDPYLSREVDHIGLCQLNLEMGDLWIALKKEGA